MDLTREDLPRVSVETLKDLKAMKTQYTQAALAQLDATIVASGLTGDKDALHFYMNKFIENTFAIAQPNLRVNGRNFEEVDDNEEEMEPFDEALDRHIWSLSDQRLQWDRTIADKRRNTPVQIEKQLKDHLGRQQEETPTLGEDHTIGRDLHTDDEAAWNGSEIEDIFRETTAMVQELNQSVPAQQERSQRIKLVEAEVKAMKP